MVLDKTFSSAYLETFFYKICVRAHFLPPPPSKQFLLAVGRDISERNHVLDGYTLLSQEKQNKTRQWFLFERNNLHSKLLRCFCSCLATSSAELVADPASEMQRAACSLLVPLSCHPSQSQSFFFNPIKIHFHDWFQTCGMNGFITCHICSLILIWRNWIG